MNSPEPANRPDRSATLTVVAAAQILGVHPVTLYDEIRARRSGGIPHIRVGRRVLVPRDAFERWLGRKLTSAS
jgi:excisionase family DNA binding protein